MFRHYLTMAVRSVARHKLYSLINTAGLALGLACVIFIVLFVHYETSYDRWVPDSSDLHRIELTLNLPGLKPTKTALTPFPMAQAMQEGIPGVAAGGADVADGKLVQLRETRAGRRSSSCPRQTQADNGSSYGSGTRETESEGAGKQCFQPAFDSVPGRASRLLRVLAEHDSRR